jgi:hypothetical protein
MLRFNRINYNEKLVKIQFVVKIIFVKEARHGSIQIETLLCH